MNASEGSGDQLDIAYCIRSLSDLRSFEGSKERVYRALRRAAEDGYPELVEHFVDLDAKCRSEGVYGGRGMPMEEAYFNTFLALHKVGALIGEAQNSALAATLRELISEKAPGLVGKLSVVPLVDPN